MQAVILALGRRASRDTITNATIAAAVIAVLRSSMWRTVIDVGVTSIWCGALGAAPGGIRTRSFRLLERCIWVHEL